jgi:ribokinase
MIPAMSVCVLGSMNVDIVATVAALPRAGETVMALRVERFPGGKGANQAVAAARMGADTLMIGCIGADDAGHWMLENLEASGVHATGVRIDPSQSTGQAYINVAATGENAIVVASGANRALTPADMTADRLRGRRVFLSQLETPVAAIAAFFDHEAAKQGIKVLNAAPAAAEGASLFPLADIIVVNETELAAYHGRDVDAESVRAVTDAARRLLGRNGQTILVTLGARGAIAVDATNAHIQAGRPARVVDTTGAGDCFCGALAAALAEGLSLAEAMKLATIAASLSVERPGATTSMPTRTEVDAAARLVQ